MLLIVYVTVWFVGGTVGALYFQSPQRRAGYDRQFAIFAYAQAVVFGLIPAVGGAWGWSVVAVPGGVFMATMMIDRRQAAIRQSEQASRHPSRDDAQSGR
jgi:hypothetical protein